MGGDIAVIGAGLITPGGVGLDANWKTLCAGRSTAESDPLLAGLPVDFSCRVPDSEITERLERTFVLRTDRFIQMALIAARAAVRDAGLRPEQWDGTRVGVVLGACGISTDTSEVEYHKLLSHRPRDISSLLFPRSAPNMAVAEISLALNTLGPGFTTSSACASGATAIGVGRDLLRAGACDIVLAGGSETGRSRMLAACFARMGLLSGRVHDPAGSPRPFDSDRDGFVLGEGAAVLAMARAEDARAEHTPVHAYLTGYGASNDAYPYLGPDPDDRGRILAIRSALADAGLAPHDIDHVNVHGTSTAAYDLAESRVFNRVFSPPPPVTATKSIVGHALGAAGAIEAVYTMLTLRHQAIPATANLENQDPDIALDVVTRCVRAQRIRHAMSIAFGLGGQNAVLVLSSSD